MKKWPRLIATLLMVFALAAGFAASAEQDGFSVLTDNLGAGIVRVEVVPPGTDPSPPSIMVPAEAVEPLSARTEKRCLPASTAGADSGLAFSAGDGQPALTLVSCDLNPDGSYQLVFKKQRGDRFYGLGEPMPSPKKFFGLLPGGPLRLNRDGELVKIWNAHNPPSEMNLPFILNPRGYGLIVDNAVRAEFDLRDDHTFTYRAEGGPARFFVISGAPKEVLNSYSRLTGRAPIPPAYAAGYMQSRYGYENEADFRWLMDNFRGRGIPCDVLIFDLDWFVIDRKKSYNMGELKWSPTNFPSGPAFQDELASRGFKSITIVEPYIWTTCSNYNPVCQLGLAATRADGSPYDFKFWGGSRAVIMDYSNPLARDWFAERVREIRLTGVDAFWTDLNEPEKDFEDMYYGGRPRKFDHNLQALYMHEGMARMYEREFPDERLFIMSRSSFVGGWRYGVSVWSGDVDASWHHLDNQIQIAQNASVSGFGLWNSDIGGFHGTPSPELYTRWMQFGAFCPVYRAHGNHSVREPWSFGEETEVRVKKVMELRYRLYPYLYTRFREMRENGMPVIRPMYLEFPGDERAEAAIDQFMYGPDLLVAPVTKQGKRERLLYLPAGTWTDFWTGQKIEGPAEVLAKAPLDQIPLYVREGAVIPMAPSMQYIGEKPLDPLTLHVYPGPDKSVSTIYFDDGATRAYERGVWSELLVTVEPRDGGAVIKLAKRDGPSGGVALPERFTAVVHADDASTFEMTIPSMGAEAE